MPDVLFVSMPFGPLFTPSIGLSLLQAALARAGIESRIRYFSIPFAERIGSSLYSAIAHSDGVPITRLAGEWIFAADLGDPSASDVDAYIARVLKAPSAIRLSPATIRRIVAARRRVPAFLDECVREIASAAPRVVGLTSSFQQHAASLALARRLKAVLPDAAIVMGGANCEGVMGAETVRTFPFVDAAVSGEADTIVVELMQRLLARESIEGMPGVRTRASVERQLAFRTFSTAPLVRDMNALPYPDYRDYVAQFEESRLARTWQPNMLFESSRGCWWGEKAHCTFCGLNGSSMTYRSKSADRALAELEHLAGTYPGADVQVVDNILEMDYFADLLPELVRRRLQLDLFYETKANLKKAQIRLLADARVTRIQPGIESFSDPVLTLMRKGVSWLQNVQLLKWCKQFGVRPYWNLIWGFPGEPPEEYERMAEVVPRLTHLPAPVGGAVVRLDRFSPNFEQADRFGFENVRPIEPYRHIFAGLSPEATANLAYYFAFDRAGADPATYVQPLARAVARWRRVHSRSELVAIRRRHDVAICDVRGGGRGRVTVLDGIDRLLHDACDGVTHVRRLSAVASDAAGAPVSDADVADRLRPLVDRGLLVTDGTRYLALAVPLGDYQPAPALLARIRRLVRSSTRQRSSKEQTWQRRRVARKRLQRKRAARRSGRPAGRSRRSA